MENELSKIRVNSIIAAVFICVTNICAIISYFIVIPNISVILVIAISVLAVIYNKAFTVSKALLRLECVILFAYLISLLFVKSTYVIHYLLYFISFGLAAFVIVGYEFDYLIIMRCMLYIYFLHLVLYYLLSRSTFLQSAEYWENQMGMAYGFMPATLVCVSLLLNQLTKTKKDTIIAILTLGMSLFAILFDFATRGVLVSLVLGFVLLIVGRYRKIRRIIIPIAILSVFVILYLDVILEQLLVLLSNTDIRALNKFISMYNRGDYTNGRSELYLNAWNYFWRSPIIGNGIGYFESCNNGRYTHQVFLEILCEFGIVGCIAYCSFLWKSLKNCLSSNNAGGSFEIVLFSSSFFVLLFSNSFWLTPIFWYYLYYKIVGWGKRTGA